MICELIIKFTVEQENAPGYKRKFAQNIMLLAMLSFHRTFEGRFIKPLMNSVGDSYLLVTEPHLSSGVPRDIHPAEKQPLVFSVSRRAAYQLGLDGLVVLLVDHVVHAVAVDQQVLLITTQTSHLHEYICVLDSLH